VSEHAVRWVERICALLLLPVFFMIAGLKVDLRAVDATAFRELGLILLVAVGGKFIGTFAGARVTACGSGTRPSWPS